MSNKYKQFNKYLARELATVFPDVRESVAPAIDGTPLWINSMARAAITYYDVVSALHDAETSAYVCSDDRVPIVVTRQDRSPALVHMEFSKLLALVERHFWKPTEPGIVIPFGDRSTR